MDRPAIKLTRQFTGAIIRSIGDDDRPHLLRKQVFRGQFRHFTRTENHHVALLKIFKDSFPPERPRH